MKFKPAPTEENFDYLKLVSTEGGWELGIFSVIFGKRIRLGRTGAPTVVLDYCAGDSPLLQFQILEAVRIVLLDVPENTDDEFIAMLFPGYSRRPIDRDPTCWTELKALRDKIKARHPNELEMCL